MYVLCVGMYRACSTWQYDVVAHLLERHREGQRLGYVASEQFAELDDRNGPEPPWSVLKSHEGHKRFASALAEGRALAVYAYRDVRDVVFSLMHKRGHSFDELLRQGMVHQILANDRFWSRRPGMLTQRYEDLIASPVTGVEQLAAYLGIKLAPDESSAIAAEYSFQTNRRRTVELGRQLRTNGVDLDDPTNIQCCDRRTLLHWNHLREGQAGGWRTEATPRQRAVLARLCNDWLTAHGYDADNPSTPASGLNAIRGETELARAWLACALRCASLSHPRIARAVKRVLGIPSDPVPAAIAARTRPGVRVDRGHLTAASSAASRPGSAPSAGRKRS